MYIIISFYKTNFKSKIIHYFFTIKNKTNKVSTLQPINIYKSIEQCSNMCYSYNTRFQKAFSSKIKKTNDKTDKIQHRRIKMKISTTEIKILIKECVKQGGMYTASDFKEYIITNSGKVATRGQISGAISQLVDTKEITRVGRGLYAKDIKETFTKKKTVDSEAEDTLKIQIYNTLTNVEKELATTISSIDIWKLNGENFEIITKMRKLRDSIEEIKSQCK